MTEVGIHDQRSIECSLCGTGNHGTGQTFAIVALDEMARFSGAPLSDFLSGQIGRTVVDENDFMINRSKRLNSKNPLEEKIDIICFVPGRNDDGDTGHILPLHPTSGYSFELIRANGRPESMVQTGFAYL